jgi:hypothetical protein
MGKMSRVHAAEELPPEQQAADTGQLSKRRKNELDTALNKIVTQFISLHDFPSRDTGPAVARFRP